MIQRKQTIYLLISFIALVIMAFTPITKFYADSPNSFSYILNIFSFNNISDLIEPPYSIGFNVPLIIIWCIITILNAVTIFLFKNRKMQMKILGVSIALLLAFIAIIFFYYSPTIEGKLSVMSDSSKCIGIYMPIVSFLCMILAHRGIKKDEQLVRSLDRLR